MKVNVSCALLCDRALEEEASADLVPYSFALFQLTLQEKAVFQRMIDHEYQAIVVCISVTMPFRF